MLLFFQGPYYLIFETILYDIASYVQLYYFWSFDNIYKFANNSALDLKYLVNLIIHTNEEKTATWVYLVFDLFLIYSYFHFHFHLFSEKFLKPFRWQQQRNTRHLQLSSSKLESSKDRSDYQSANSSEELAMKNIQRSYKY